MKKTFFQLHPGFIFVLSLFFALFLLGAFAFVVVGTLLWEIITIEGFIITQLLIVSVLMAVNLFFIVLTVWQICAMVYYRIIFLDDKIIITGDKLDKDSKIQFKDEFVISEIKNVKFIISNRNSKRKTYHWYVRSGYATKSYFEFEMENGDKKWVFIFYFSKKQRKNMINIINEKTGLNIDYDILYKNYEFRPERKKKNKKS